MTTIAVSFKSYFSAAQTRDWLATAAAGLDERRAAGARLPRLVVLPAAPLLPEAVRILDGTGTLVGAQDVSPTADGAVTGGVPATLLAELGVRVAELGHAERRRIFAEDDAVVACKLARAAEGGLTPLLCVGEDQRTAPATAADLVIAELDRLLALAWPHAEPPLPLLVAYEPHWAIGQPAPATPAHVRAVGGALRVRLATLPHGGEVLYGGSAGPGLFAALDGAVDGLFLGRFAHDPAAFLATVDEASIVNERA